MGLKKDYQEIVLPESGEKLTVRKLSTADWQYIGSIPDTLAYDWLKIQGKSKTNVVDDMSPESRDFVLAAAMRGIVKHPEGFTLSDKHPKDCADDEFSFYDLKSEDQACLMIAIFSGGEGVPFNFPDETSGEKG